MGRAVIELVLHDSGTSLWSEARERASAPGTGLVVAGRTASGEQTRAAGVTIYGETRLLTIGELFGVTEAALPAGERPPSASDRLVRLAALDHLLGDPEIDVCPELRRCRPTADREVLLAWIDQVSARADVEHREAAATPVELGIERLREALDERGLISETRRRAHIARRASLVRLCERLVVGPLPLSDPFSSGLLKGLASRQDVSVLGLTAPALVKEWLATARLGPEWRTPGPALALERSDVVAALYSGRSGEGGVTRVEAGDELEEGLEHIRALIAGGLRADQITLALARPERDLLRLEQLAVRAGVPLAARRAVGAADTPLGAVALAASRPGVDAEALAFLGRAVGLRLADAFALAEGTGLGRARRIHAVLTPLAERVGAPSELRAREMNWLDALAGEIAIAEPIQPPPSCAEIVSGAATRSLPLGDPAGVAVVGYAEAQGLERSHLIATGLSDGEWPPRERPSPFISAATLSACPGLAPPDRRVDFVSALAAHRSTLLVREARDGAGRDRAPSVLYAAATTAGATPEAAPTRIRRPRPPVRGHEAVRDEIRELARDKATFTISELSLYLDCPRGWEVKHGLGLAEAEHQLAIRGGVAHRMLESAFEESELPIEERLERAWAALARDEAARAIDPPTRAIITGQVTRVVSRYSPPRWPFTPLDVERDFTLRYDALGAEIHGRADRIDEMPDGSLLLLDYKGRRPSWRNANVLARNFQACLYPIMVAERLRRPVFGSIFISVGHDGYDGLVRRLAPGLDAPTLHLHPGLLSSAAEENMIGAIEGIRAGRFDGDSPGCWSGCPCHSLRIAGRPQ